MRLRILGSIRGRLLASYLLLTVIPLGVLGVYLFDTVNRFYLGQVQAYMASEAAILADSVSGALSTGTEVPGLFLQNTPPLALRAEPLVTVFDLAGRVVLTSDPALAERVGEQVSEPGISAALNGQVATAVEANPLGDGLFAYVAQPVRANNQIVGVVHIQYSLTDVERAQDQLRLVILGAGLLAAGLATLLSIWLTRGIVHPLEQLRRAAATIAAGRKSRPVNEDTLAEAAGLAREFNRMVAALNEAQDARQITFASIAHDIRTPMGSIQAAAEALAAGAVDQPALRDQLLAGLVRQAQYIGRLADDLMRLAAYEGGLTLRRAPVDLGQLACRAVEALSARAQSQGVELGCAAAAGLPPVSADADRLLEVLFNLLDNALTYSPPGGQVHVQVEDSRQRHEVRVHVLDEGPGIPPEALPHLFERPQRGEYRRTAGGAHLGLGLNIASTIVRAHGGTLAASNRPEGGADFTVSLPYAA